MNKDNGRRASLLATCAELFVVIISVLAIILWLSNYYSAKRIVPAIDGDFGLTAMLGKSIQENGLKGYVWNSQIGYPDVSALFDTPFIDLAYLFEFWGVIKITKNYMIATYYLYFLSYSLAALTTWILLKYLDIPRPIRIVLSIAYAFAPYHFMRGMGHPTLSNYYILPLSILVVLITYKEKFKYVLPERYGFKQKLSFLCLLCLIGMQNVYYAFFSMLMVLVVVIYKMIYNKTLKPLFQEMGVFVIQAVAFILSLSPKLIYSYKYGMNEYAGIRLPLETEMYALKIIQLLLPPSYTRFSWLQRIVDEYRSTAFNINENALASLGVVAGSGFLLACVLFCYRYAKNEIRSSSLDQNLDILIVLLLILVLYSIPGGFGDIFSRLIMPELRCLNRVSILIAALSITILAIFIKKLLWQIKYKWALILISSALVIVGIYIDLPERNPDNWNVAAETQDEMYREFFATVEEKVGTGAAVYQLPFMEFPEAAPIINMQSYSHFKGYIYTDTIKWSYGGMKGRNLTAQKLYVDNGMSESFINGIKEAGFSGVYIDSSGFEDGGTQICEFYHDYLNEEPLISKDGRLFFFVIE